MRIAADRAAGIMRLLSPSALLLAALNLSLRGAAGEVQIEMRNVRLHAADGVVLAIASLRGEMISRKPGAPPVFDDRQSYVLKLRRAEISLDLPSLQNLLTHHVFGYEGSSLNDLSVQIDEGRLVLKGKLHKGVSVPFSVKASVSATDDGRMRLHSESLKAAGVRAKGLLDLFGLKLEDVVGLKTRRGVEVQDNDIIISVGHVLPPPEIAGRLARVSISGSRLVQVFDDPASGPAATLTRPSPRAANYIYFGGGDIRFGKLTMHDADLQLIDSDPKDPFDFYPARYDAQLVAGYSKNTPSHGLKTYMPDYDDLRQPPRRPQR